MISVRHALARHPESAHQGDAVQWRPHTLCDRHELVLLNACAVRRTALKGSIEGLPLEVGLSPAYASVAPTVADDRFEAIFSWGCASAKLILASAIVRRVLDRIQPGLSDDPPDDPTLSLLIELALAPLLARVEMSTGTFLTLRSSCHRAKGDLPTSEAQIRWLVFDGMLEDIPFEFALEFDGDALESFVALLRHAAPEKLPLAETPVPILVLLSTGAVQLSVRLLQDLRPGDVLIPDEFPFERGELILTFGHGYRAIASLEGNGARIRSPLQRIRSIQETSTMEDKDAPRVVETSELGELEIQLTFELGRQLVELDQLRTMVPGHLFPLGRSPDDPVDIVANGRRIGRGEIVRVGDGLGVRLTRLFDHG